MQTLFKCNPLCTYLSDGDDPHLEQEVPLFVVDLLPADVGVPPLEGLDVQVLGDLLLKEVVLRVLAFQWPSEIHKREQISVWVGNEDNVVLTLGLEVAMKLIDNIPGQI